MTKDSGLWEGVPQSLTCSIEGRHYTIAEHQLVKGSKGHIAPQKHRSLCSLEKEGEHSYALSLLPVLSRDLRVDGCFQREKFGHSSQALAETSKFDKAAPCGCALLYRRQHRLPEGIGRTPFTGVAE
jgi:hypothetical protein